MKYQNQIHLVKNLEDLFQPVVEHRNRDIFGMDHLKKKNLYYKIIY